MSKFDPLGLRKNDPLERHRDAMERQEQEFAAARRERQRQERQEQRRSVEAAEREQLRSELHAELAKLAERREIDSQAVGEAIAATADELVLRFEEHAARMRSSILDAFDARCTALEAQLKAVEGRAAKADFRFARERDAGEVIDMPNPLRKMN
jgi:hypothetical protein